MSSIEPDLPDIVRKADSLAELAGQINAAHDAGLQSTRKGLTYFRQVGAMLTRAKEKCGHGHWLEWVSKNLSFSDRQARKYMQLDREWDQVKLELDSDLDGALKILAGNAPDGEKVRSDSKSTSVAGEGGPQPHRFAEELAAVTGTARRITQAMAGDSDEAKKLRDYLSYAGLVEHTGATIVGSDHHKATVSFLPLKGAHMLIDLAGQPGRKTAEEIRRIYDRASGGWIPPITARRRKSRN